MTLDPKLKKEIGDFFEKFWNKEPQKSFPELVEFFKEQGIDIRIRPNIDRARNRNTVYCDACGHEVGHITNIHIGGCRSVPSFKSNADRRKEQREKDESFEKTGLPDPENIRFVVS